MHEHIDMQDPEKDKEDCELNAARRLLLRLKKFFPKLPVILLGDALYSCRPVMAMCEKHGWHYCFTFKEGRTPAVWQEAVKLLELSPENTLSYSGVLKKTGGRCEGDIRWVEGVDLSDSDHRNLFGSVIEQNETVQGITTHYMWVTSWTGINKKNVFGLVQSTGRKRHTIEDQLNNQKNNG